MRPSIFLPYARTIATVDRPDARALRDMTIVLRSVAEPTGLVNAAPDITRKLDPDAPMFRIATMTEQLDRALWTRRAYSWLFGAFAMIAILLAAAGVYGLVSYVVSQRTRENGIRMALGARPGDVLRQVTLSGMTLTIGAAAGLTGALLVARLLRTLLFGVSAYDPIVYEAMAAGALGVGLIATLVPARRAARVIPCAHCISSRSIAVSGQLRAQS